MNFMSESERLRRVSHARRLLRQGATINHALKRARTSRDALRDYLTSIGDRMENYGGCRRHRQRLIKT